MSIDSFHTQHDYVSWFVEYPAAKFQTKSGGNIAGQGSQTFPGGGGPPKNLDGPSSTGPITITKGLDHVIDRGLIAWAKAWHNGIRRKLTLICQPVNELGIPVGEADTYLRCSLNDFSKPDLNKGSAELATLSITVQPETIG